MTVKLPSADSVVDKVLLGFFAFFGWQLAVWVNGFIPWPG
jgi:hypothetical protein